MRQIGQQLDGTKSKVQKLMGIPVVVKIVGARGKSMLCKGKVSALFPAVFTVQMDDGSTRTFSYNDVHAKNVLFLKRKDT